ncbi:methyltransferase [Actinoallomurus sp. CA-150999]|uniref:methyltransferase n=1 Tax=Actinoallomurus sp. CA-150999 TaxID=3239887 RepID=UPI003D93B067
MPVTTDAHVDPLNIMLSGWSFMKTKILLAAIELDVFTPLSRRPLTEPELRDELGLHPRATRDFLDTLVAMNVLERDEDDRYRATADAERYLAQDQRTYLGSFLGMTVNFLSPAFDGLVDTLRTGKAHGEDENGEVPFAQIWQNPMALQFFLTGMDTMNGTIGPELAKVFDWSRYESFVDCGGARGNLAAAIAQAHPHLHGGVFDLPPVEAFFKQLVADRQVSDRLVFHPGDFFVDPLPEADVLIFGNALHDWSVEQRKELIKKAFNAVRPGGALLVYDPMLDSERRRLDNLLLSMYMLTSSPGGCEYTPDACADWMREAGFTSITSKPLPAKETVVIGHKAA